MTQQDFENKLKEMATTYGAAYPQAVENACESEYYWNAIEDIIDSASLNVPLDCDDFQETLNIIEMSLEGILSSY